MSHPKTCNNYIEATWVWFSIWEQLKQSKLCTTGRLCWNSPDKRLATIQYNAFMMMFILSMQKYIHLSRTSITDYWRTHGLRNCLLITQVMSLNHHIFHHFMSKIFFTTDDNLKSLKHCHNVYKSYLWNELFYEKLWYEMRRYRWGYH